MVNGQQVLPAGGGARGGLRPRPRAPNASHVARPRPTSRPRPAHSEEGARRGRRPGEWRTSSTNSLPEEHRSKRRVPAMPRQEGEEGLPLRAWRRASPATPPAGLSSRPRCYSPCPLAVRGTNFVPREAATRKNLKSANFPQTEGAREGSGPSSGRQTLAPSAAPRALGGSPAVAALGVPAAGWPRLAQPPEICPASCVTVWTVPVGPQVSQKERRKVLGPADTPRPGLTLAEQRADPLSLPQGDESSQMMRCGCQGCRRWPC